MESKKEFSSRSPAVVDSKKPIEPEWNASQIEYQLAIAPLGREKLCWKDNEKLMQQLYERMANYLEVSKHYDKKIGNLNCYMALGVRMQEVDYIVNGSSHYKVSKEVVEFFRKVKEFCAAYRESLASDGKINPVTAIFWQKNYDGLRDQQEIFVENSNAIETEASYTQLENKYKKLIVSEAEFEKEKE